MVFFMKVLSIIISYLSRMLLARNLTPQEYGLFFAVFTFVALGNKLRGIGLGQALVKYIAEFNVRHQYNEIKTAIASVILMKIIGSVILGGIFFLMAEFLARHYFKHPDAEFLLKMLILLFFIKMLFVTAVQVLRGMQKVNTAACSEFIINTLVLLMLFVFFPVCQNKVNVPLFAYISASLIASLLFQIIACKTFPFFRYEIRDFVFISKKLLLFGLLVLVTGFGGQIISYFDTLMLIHFRSLEEVGVYNVILPSALVFLFLSRSISYVVFPVISELWAKSDRKRVSEGLRLVHKYAFLFIIPPLCTVFVFSRMFIIIFFGSQYVTGSAALQILLVGMLFFSIAGINNNIISGIGHPQTVTGIVLFSALFNITANIILIPHFGIQGAAAATSLSYLINMVLSTYHVGKYIKLSYPVTIWLKLAFSGSIFMLIIYYLKGLSTLNPWVELMLTTTTASLVYLLLNYLLGTIDFKEMKKYLLLATRELETVQPHVNVKKGA